ncbi:MAG: DNA (cytosine-5-)-methyltransferase [Chloroflexota bacterium]|nr:DNA (cytosine-5-)-methyltransferase [Chloroflexota bacterium]
MRFIDLFAGLGGFHLALRNLGHTCVFACEVDETLRAVYEKNYGMKPAGDIRAIDAVDIPTHEILCAGFPCQPFSKAKDGQPGLEDPKLGDLYLQILRVVHHHHPLFLILENVPNLERHDDGQTWERIKKLLEAEDYDVSIRKLSPHEFGIPQIRERIYIVGSLGPLNGFKWPEKTNTAVSIHNILDQRPPEAQVLSRPKRFYATVHLNPLRMSSEAGTIGQEVIQHLEALLGSKVEVTLEVAAESPVDGFPDNVVRMVTENARTLKFDNSGLRKSEVVPNRP